MYLFLGGDTSVREDNIIGVFDMDNTTVAASTKKFLARAQKEGKVITISYELPKSFIVTEDKIYVSSLNTSTLLKRTRQELNHYE